MHRAAPRDAAVTRWRAPLANRRDRARDDGAADKTACTNTSGRFFQTKTQLMVCFLTPLIFCLMDYDILKRFEGGFILILSPEKHWRDLK